VYFELIVFELSVLYYTNKYYKHRDHRGRDRVVFGFTTTYAISAYHH
jgi:hypothetical protein